MSRRQGSDGGVASVLALSALSVIGCPLPPAQVCQAYVACQAAIDSRVDTTAYADEGSCWTLPDTARRCEAHCEAALDALLQTPDPPAVCRAHATVADG
jgi:hypothetical protein